MAYSVDSFGKSLATVKAEVQILKPVIKEFDKLNVETLTLAEAQTHLENLTASLLSLNNSYKSLVVASFDQDKDLSQSDKNECDVLSGEVAALRDLLFKYQVALKTIISTTENSQKIDQANDDFSFKHYKNLLPSVNIPKFSGNNCNESLEYFSFKTAFDDIITNKSKIPNSIKLVYLKSFLDGYALKIVQHFTTSDANFQNAVALLDKEFLNRNAITDVLFAKLLKLFPKNEKDSKFLNVKLYINEVRAILNDLNVNGVNLQTDMSSEKFISHIVFSKLPFAVKQELIRKTNNNYPSITDIFEHYAEIIHQLNLKSTDYALKPKASNFVGTVPSSRNSPVQSRPKQLYSQVASGESMSEHNGKKANTPIAQEVVSEMKRLCKFCLSEHHTSVKCCKFPSLKERIARLKQLSLCEKCCGKNHTSSLCKFNTVAFPFACCICKERSHISPLCNKI